MKTTRTPERIHTRELDRYIARHNMNVLGLRQVAKGKHSFFSDNWEKYSEVDLGKERRKSRRRITPTSPTPATEASTE